MLPSYGPLVAPITRLSIGGRGVGGSGTILGSRGRRPSYSAGFGLGGGGGGSGGPLGVTRSGICTRTDSARAASSRNTSARAAAYEAAPRSRCVATLCPIIALAL